MLPERIYNFPIKYCFVYHFPFIPHYKIHEIVQAKKKRKKTFFFCFEKSIYINSGSGVFVVVVFSRGQHADAFDMDHIRYDQRVPYRTSYIVLNHQWMFNVLILCVGYVDGIWVTDTHIEVYIAHRMRLNGGV